MSKRTGIVFFGLCALTASGAPLRAQSQGAGAASVAAPAPAPLAVGTPAPNVSLVIRGKTMPLKSLLAGNRTLVLFYPAGCTSCDSQLQAIDKDALQALGRIGFATFAVSPDLPAAQAATASRLSLSYPVLSDPNGAAAKAFHVSGPTAFLIDVDGTIGYVSSGAASGSDLTAAARTLKRSSRAKS